MDETGFMMCRREYCPNIVAKAMEGGELTEEQQICKYCRDSEAKRENRHRKRHYGGSRHIVPQHNVPQHMRSAKNIPETTNRFALPEEEEEEGSSSE